MSERTLSDASSQEGFDQWELRGHELEDLQAYVQDLLDRAICSIQTATNQASRRRARQRLQRKLSDFLTKEQYEEAMQQFKVLCETRLGYVWRVAQHMDDKSSGQPGVCYLQFNEMSLQWEHSVSVKNDSLTNCMKDSGALPQSQVEVKRDAMPLRKRQFCFTALHFQDGIKMGLSRSGGDYKDIKRLSCTVSADQLFHWPDLKRGLSMWLESHLRGYGNMTQIFWEQIRPIQHDLTNIIGFHEVMVSRDCILGILAVRSVYLLTMNRTYRQQMILDTDFLISDWYYMVYRFPFSLLVDTGWAPIVFSAWALLSQSLKQTQADLVWTDCEDVPGVGSMSSDMQEFADAPAEIWQRMLSVISNADEAMMKRCPLAFSYIAGLLSAVEENESLQKGLLDVAQHALRHYREKNNFTFANVLLSSWNVFGPLAHSALVLDEKTGLSKKKSCHLLWCPEGGTPNYLLCRCERVFSQNYRNTTICIFMVDTRRRSSLRNITSVLNARYWTLAFGVNKAYAHDYGYEIDYVNPDEATHFPKRKVGWAKIKVLINELRQRGPERCAYGVSIDTDAFIRTSEPLAAIINDYGLAENKLIMFSQEYHVETVEKGNTAFINGGFFIVRNTQEGIGLLQEWYDVPDVYQDMAHLKMENPQGLNMCWDQKMQEKYAAVTALGEPHLFTAPLGLAIRHNWFKDLRFEQEMQDILLHRLQRRYNCIVCQNVYDWDDSNNTDPGWR
ncbi:PKHD1L1 [Symbiodinium natans]|uniref:PKHD1L1 protein n=1 Tax=Symbiodinium natans TaxID=878477 RepID=A0A812JI98_9DINO|nr:PKHD1L1 [Symbiodinium natans]